MNIVVAGSLEPESLEWQLCDAFNHLGHQAQIIAYTSSNSVLYKSQYWLSKFVKAYDEATNQRLAERIVSQKPDFVLILYRYVHPLVVKYLKQNLPGVPIAHFNPDQLTTMDRQQIIAADFDFYFTKEPYLVDALRNKAGLNAYYLPESYNLRYNDKLPIPKAEAERSVGLDVVMYGNIYPYRTRMAERLLQAGINLTIYGMMGPFCSPQVKAVFTNRMLGGVEKNQVIYGAKIIFNNFHYAEITSANQKYFEINGAGGFQLSDYKPTLEEFSGIPTEKVTFKTIDEAIDLIRYYLPRPAERYALAEQQQQHFMQHHTLDQRVSQMLSIVSGSTVVAPFL